ncbi:asparagine synthetase B family protein [Vacuolonema iberomarrocanum]|uniref:asparagine synthetase B family protein n=1 Tax=Vacuolonema iberomarrocanum TaxID=3454632 RepID=UPI003F6DE43D
MAALPGPDNCDQQTVKAIAPFLSETIPLSQHGLGFWGVGEPNAVRHKVCVALERLGLAFPQKTSVVRSGREGAIVSGFLCPAQPDFWEKCGNQGEFAENPAIALSASGGLTCELEPGMPVPDAWIRLGERLTLGRDPFGRVPLFWMVREEILWFSTQLRWLVALQEQRPEISVPGLYGYAGCSYVPTPWTPIAGIHAVPAATEMCWQKTAAGDWRTASRRYWQWQQAADQITEEGEAIAQLHTLLQSAIQRQLSHLPGGKVGVLLSGGLDSSIVAALLVQAGVEVQAYTLDLGEVKESELPYAQQVADFLRIPLTSIPVAPRQVRRAIAATAQALDQPFGDGVTVPFYLLNQRAAADVDVIFNGENGDQLFAGWTNKPLIAAGIYHATQPQGGTDLSQHYLRTFHRLYGYERQAFAPDLWPQIESCNSLGWLDDALSSDDCQDFLHQMRRATLMLKGAQNIQPRATALAWAHDLQVRSPFCDIALSQWAFRLAGSLQLQGSCEKYILKRAVEGWLPPEVVWREKRGMGVPLTTWCFGGLWHDLGRWLNPATLRREGLWHPQLPLRVVKRQLGNLQGRRMGEILWLLVMWQMWRAEVLGDRPTRHAFDHPFWLPYGVWDFLRREVLNDS